MNLWFVHLDGIIVLRNTKMPASHMGNLTAVHVSWSSEISENPSC
ncbi:hypothetical protein T06_4270 [Trichinella sp. T6]|nr:hypothetical protein T06_4270 [Trichinella sp. T6]